MSSRRVHQLPDMEELKRSNSFGEPFDLLGVVHFQHSKHCHVSSSCQTILSLSSEDIRSRIITYDHMMRMMAIENLSELFDPNYDH